MSRFQIVLLATAFPLIAGGSYCLSWQDLGLLSPVISSNGRIFGVVDANGQVRGREIWEWPADLSVQRTIRPDDGLRIACSASGDMLALQHYRTLLTIDSDSGQTAWEIASHDSNYGPVAAVHNGEFFAVQSFNWQTDVTRLAFHRAADGSLAETLLAKGEIKIKSRGGQTAYRDNNGDLFFIEIDEHGIRHVKRGSEVACFALHDDGSTLVVDNEQNITRIDADGNSQQARGVWSADSIWDIAFADAGLVTVDRASNVRLVDLTTGTRKHITRFAARPSLVPYAIGGKFIVSGDVRGQIAVTDLATGTTQRRELQVMSRGDMTLVLFAVSLVYMLWSFALLRDGAHSERRGRVVMDAALVVLLPHCMWLGNTSIYVNHTAFNFGFVVFLIGLWSALIGGMILFEILYSRKPWVVWAVTAFSSIAITFAPVAALAWWLRWRRWRIDDQSIEIVVAEVVSQPKSVHRQFTIRGLLLTTAAIGAVLGYFRYIVAGNSEFIAAGIGIAVPVFVASLVGVHRRLSLAVLPVSLFLMGSSSLIFPIFRSGTRDLPVVILCPATALFLFTHLGLHGHALKRETPNQSTTQLTTATK